MEVSVLTKTQLTTGLFLRIPILMADQHSPILFKLKQVMERPQSQIQLRGLLLTHHQQITLAQTASHFRFLTEMEEQLQAQCQ
jgi:hypothetical protein